MPSRSQPKDAALRIHDLLGGIAAKRPTAEAVRDGGRRWTYEALCRDIDQMSRALLAHGIRRGDRVAMLTPPCAEFWIVLHATAAIGAIWVGINPKYQKRDFELVISDARPKLIMAVSPFEDRDYVEELRPFADDQVGIIAIGPACEGATALKSFLEPGLSISQPQLNEARRSVDPEDPAIIVYTSGTTGRPKGAMLSHRAIALSAQTNAAWMHADALESAICAAPVNHVGAINNICMNVMAAGGRLIFYPRVDIAALAQLSAEEKPTYLVSSPTGFAMMLGGGQGSMQRIATTRLIVHGGAATPQSVLEQIAPCGARLISVYGQTETCGIITRTRDTDSLEQSANTIGEPIEGAELRLGDSHGAAVPDGQIGEIQIRAPYVMSGYFNNPVASAEAFTPDGFLRTGDIGRIREDGRLVFVGRLKEMFKSGGYNVYPVEIEQAICEHPAVALAAVVSVEHPTFQEVGHAFVQPEPSAVIDPDELAQFLRSRIANYKIPKRFVVESELPRLPNGKVDKLSLKARASS